MTNTGLPNDGASSVFRQSLLALRGIVHQVDERNVFNCGIRKYEDWPDNIRRTGSSTLGFK